MNADTLHRFFLEVQERLIQALERADGPGRFLVDDWSRPGGGGGRTCVLSEGAVFERGGVNVSMVHGELPEHFAKELPGRGLDFLATGVSIVMHPRSPHVPTFHANLRYLTKSAGDETVAWFGGGTDLTPWILYDEDASHFHRVLREVCGRHVCVDYRTLKKQCDEYFYLPHRGETRGVGGIFFDYLGLDPPRGITASYTDARGFVEDCAAVLMDAYLPIVERRKTVKVSEAEREWQLFRRGRYVEFNLIFDRGTVFGLKTNGRTESILMSLPSLVRWGYNQRPTPGTFQERLVQVLQNPRDW